MSRLAAAVEALEWERREAERDERPHAGEGHLASVVAAEARRDARLRAAEERAWGELMALLQPRRPHAGDR